MGLLYLYLATYACLLPTLISWWFFLFVFFRIRCFPFVCVCVYIDIHLCQIFKFSERGVSSTYSTLLYFTLLTKTLKNLCVTGVPKVHNFFL